MRLLTARLESGASLDYLPEVGGEGGMKTVHFTPDRSQVVCFFKDKSTSVDPQRRARLQAIVGRYNPTLDPNSGDYWKALFCWPTAIVTQPELGVVAPTYAPNFFFASGPFAGKEKQSNWFTSPKLRRMLPESERGTWLSYWQISIRIARAIRRLHNAGLAHSDLSNKNVLVDPTSGNAVIIDIDSLVVPQMFPPDVLGTPGYIAPEVLATQDLELEDPRRVLPSRRTDQHALAVLIYEYLLGRHPLRGPKVNSTASAEEDEQLSMGQNALWIENPDDTSNRPANLKLGHEILGPYVAPLLERAFIAGLHAPEERPGANEWERALVRSTDGLMPCPNPNCEGKWFILDIQSPNCPFCGTAAPRPLALLNFYREGRAGQFSSEKHSLVVWHHQRLYRWHAFDNVFPGEGADRTPLGYFAWHNSAWWLVNQSPNALLPLNAAPILPGAALQLKDGQAILLARGERARLALVRLIR